MKKICTLGDNTCYDADSHWIIKDENSGKVLSRVSKKVFPYYDSALVTKWGYKRVDESKTEEGA